MKRILYILLWFLMGATVLGASVPVNSYASELTYTVPKIAVTLVSTTVTPGATEQLDIQIEEIQGRRTSLILVVNYPSGQVDRSLNYIENGNGSLTWAIPADAGVGEATFKLVADGCNCGEHNTIPLQAPVDGTITGRFIIADIQ